MVLQNWYVIFMKMKIKNYLVLVDRFFYNHITLFNLNAYKLNKFNNPFVKLYYDNHKDIICVCDLEIKLKEYLYYKYNITMTLNEMNLKTLRIIIKNSKRMTQKDFIESLSDYELDKIVKEYLKTNLNEIINIVYCIDNKKINNMSKEEEIIFDKIKHYICITPLEKNETYHYIRMNTLMQFNKKENEYKNLYPTKELVYMNQRECANNILKEFNDNKRRAITLIALPQVGKTGTFLYTAIQAILNPNDKQMFLPENIYIITGLSDIYWLQQTKNDMTDELKNNVYHLNTIKKLIPIIKTKINTRILLIIDECHIASSKDQTIDNLFSQLQIGEENIGDVYENFSSNNTVYFLNVSATPSAILYDMSKWGDNHCIVYLEPSSLYVGFQTFIDENRIESIDNNMISYDFLNNKFKSIVSNRYMKPKYHIFRISGINQDNRSIIEKWAVKNNYDVEYYDTENKNSNISIDDLLDIKPKKHTFIIIKNFWRAGKRMNDSNIGVAYECNVDINFDVTAQGLIGRFCGNDKRKLPDIDTPYFFCNVKTIKEYLTFINSKCDLRKSNYTSTKFKTVNGQVKHVVPTCFENITNIMDGVSDLFEKSDYIDLPYDIVLDETYYDKILKKEYDTMDNEEKQTNFDIKKNLILNNIFNHNPELHQKIYNYNCDNIFIAGIRDKDIEENNKSYKKHIIDLRNHIKSKIYNIPHCKNFKNKKIYTNFYTCVIDNRSNPKRVIIQVYNGVKYEQLEKNVKKKNDILLS